jgi:1-acyl-sn-glycerol-3-phosphate acyltransferase
MSISMMVRDRRFAPLMWTQFFGALNDNILKNAFVVLLAFRGVQLWGLRSDALVSLATLVFIVPFFLFSALAGQLADKFEKSGIIRTVKLIEIGIMMLAGVGFYLHAYPVLFGVLFLMGLHSTFFGPVKYSSLPELVSADRLTSANAYVEVGTFLAILIGTLAGGYLVSLPTSEHYVVSLLLVNSVMGYALSRRVPPMTAADAGIHIDRRLLRPVLKVMRAARESQAVYNSILGISWFWFLGAVVLSVLPSMTKDIVNGTEHVVTLFLATFTIGIALGAVVCEKLSFERVEIGLVPIGSLGMTAFLVHASSLLSEWVAPTAPVSIAGFFQQPRSVWLVGDLLGLAMFGGVFTVPLYTLVQQRSDPTKRSQVIGANNIMNALFMVVGSGLLMVFLQLQIKLPTILLLYAAFNLLIAVYIYSLVPEFTLRFLSWVLARCLYRLRCVGSEHVPKEGAAMVVCNHVSFVDWLVVAAAVKRPIRFVMYYKFAEIPVLKYLMRHAGVIPIAGRNENPEVFERAFALIAQSLQQGHLVGVFPEGAISRDGEIHEFKRGIEHMLSRNPVPVVPMALQGLWGSIFSHRDGPAMTKLPRRIWFAVTLRIGEALPPEHASAAELERRVRALASKR